MPVLWLEWALCLVETREYFVFFFLFFFFSFFSFFFFFILFSSQDVIELNRSTLVSVNSWSHDHQHFINLSGTRVKIVLERVRSNLDKMQAKSQGCPVACRVIDINRTT
jgi:hypothetical protein